MTSRNAHGVRAAVALAALLSGCDGTPLDPSGALVGSWGGDGFGLEISADSASAVFTCAYGTLEAPIVLDSDRGFTTLGAYVREVGPAALRSPASYRGRLIGSLLELSVVVTDTIGSAGTYMVGPFVGTRGGTPRVFYCQ